MAIKSSGVISMGGTHDGTDGSILNEKQGSTTARTSVSLKGLSVDGVADSSGGDITGTPDGSTPYKMSEFYNYSQDLPFTAVSFTGSYNQFTQGKNSTQRRGFFSYSDSTHRLAASGNTTIYTITNVASKNEYFGPNSSDTDSTQGLIISGTTPSNSSPDPVGWNRITFSNSSNNASVQRTDMTFYRNNSFFSFSLAGETMILAQSGTGTATFS